MYTYIKSEMNRLLDFICFFVLFENCGQVTNRIWSHDFSRRWKNKIPIALCGLRIYVTKNFKFYVKNIFLE